MRKKEKIAKAKRRNRCNFFFFNLLKIFVLICAVKSIRATCEANKRAEEARLAAEDDSEGTL